MAPTVVFPMQPQKMNGTSLNRDHCRLDWRQFVLDGHGSGVYHGQSTERRIHKDPHAESRPSKSNCRQSTEWVGYVLSVVYYDISIKERNIHSCLNSF